MAPSEWAVGLEAARKLLNGLDVVGLEAALGVEIIEAMEMYEWGRYGERETMRKLLDEAEPDIVKEALLSKSIIEAMVMSAWDRFIDDFKTTIGKMTNRKKMLKASYLINERLKVEAKWNSLVARSPVFGDVEHAYGSLCDLIVTIHPYLRPLVEPQRDDYAQAEEPQRSHPGETQKAGGGFADVGGPRAVELLNLLLQFIPIISAGHFVCPLPTKARKLPDQESDS